MKFLDNFQEHSYALFRIICGYLFLWHGAQKFFNFPKEFAYDLSAMMYAAGSIELIGGAMVMIGLFTRPAAFLCSGLMAAAYWMAHASASTFYFPILNGGELAVIFCFAFLYIAARGTGMWGVGKD